MTRSYVRDLVRHPVALRRLRARAMLLPTSTLRELRERGEYGDRGTARAVLRRRPWGAF